MITGNQNKKLQNYDEIVDSSFNQFLQAVAKNKFYELYINKNEAREERDPCKIINANHIYCLFCNENYYAYSDFNDINSFFQKHLNTNYHKSSTLISSISNKTEILVWEILGVSGYCKVCNISGLNAIVFDTGLTAADLKNLHGCKEQIRDFEKTFSNSEILKKFCNLSVLVQKFIKKDEDQVKCLLCSKILLGPDNKVEHHCVSEEHSMKFLKFVEQTFNFKLKDLLNGFHLEVVIRWILNNKINFHNVQFENCNEWEACLNESNKIRNLYDFEKNYHQIIPKFLEKLLGINSKDFIIDKQCFLCVEVNIDSSHKQSEKHLLNLASANNILKEHMCIKDVYVKQCRARLMSFESDIKNYFIYQNQLQLVRNVSSKKGRELDENCITFTYGLQTCVMCLLPFWKEKNVNCCTNCALLMTDDFKFLNKIFETTHSFYNTFAKYDENTKHSKCESKKKVSKTTIKKSNVSNLNDSELCKNINSKTETNKLQAEQSPTRKNFETPKSAEKNTFPITIKNNTSYEATIKEGGGK